MSERSIVAAGTTRLPATPDLVFPRLRKVIFVSGCFWHMHGCERGRRIPAARRKSYWLPKLQRNRARDRRVRRQLRRAGWGVLVVWECQIRRGETLAVKIKSFLER